VTAGGGPDGNISDQIANDLRPTPHSREARMPGPTSAVSTASEQLWERAQRHLPGGVTASARIHAALGRSFLAERALGGRVWDVDGREYVDLNMSFGASLLGHANPAVVAAVIRATELGIMCGYETDAQVRLAERIAEVIPSAELVRFAGSGTETTWHALRTAKVATGRTKVVKFEGHFHGFNDSLGYSFWPSAEEAGPESSPRAVPESAGMPAANADHTFVLPWNDAAALEAVFAAHGPEIAAVVMEPVNHDSGTILPVDGYLEAARDVTRRHGAVLIFDEVLSGFRTGVGGAQAQYGVTPDVTTLGKTLGGGTALSAFVGSRDVMSAVAPLGRAVHSGTYNAHLIPVMAGLAFLDQATDATFYPHLRQLGDAFYPELQAIFDRAGLQVLVQSMGARFSLLFGLERAPVRYRDILAADTVAATRFYGLALEEGVYFHVAWHHGFSVMHTTRDLEVALEGVERAARRLAAERPIASLA
jgi:glutamate-1-semialdehyde 2,1-aminomutase